MSSRDLLSLPWWRVHPVEEVAVEDVWPMVHAERAVLIGDLERLDEGRWEEPSLCAEWTVHDVVAHLVDTARTTRLGFLAGLARARFDFDRQNARGVERARGASPRETLERLRQAAARTSTPPAPLDEAGWWRKSCTERTFMRPLGIVRSYPEEAVVRSLRLQVRTPASFGGAREIVAHTRLTASDADLSIGEGPEVSGPVLSLLLAVSRRRVALDDLDGPGLAALAGAI